MSWINRYKKRYIIEPMDLQDPDGVTCVQIAALDTEETNFNNEKGIRHLLLLRGWTRKLKLNNSMFDLLGMMFPGDDEGILVGKNIYLTTQITQEFGETKQKVTIHVKRPPPDALAVDQVGQVLPGQVRGQLPQKPGFPAATEDPNAPMGLKAACVILSEARRRDLTRQQLEHRLLMAELGGAINGREMPAWPNKVKPTLRAFMAEVAPNPSKPQYSDEALTELAREFEPAAEKTAAKPPPDDQGDSIVVPF
ncbi:MAG: hypothetical protein SFZ23_08760 [Planctomycetota bacterium]|nr:hypothetical protein [Planctomycetota bacterium]